MRLAPGCPRGLGCVLTLAVLVSLSATSQAKEPVSEEVVRHLIRAALLEYFDPASVFEISVSGTALKGETLSIEDLLIEGKPAVMRGFRGEILAHVTDLQLDMTGLAGGKLNIARYTKASVVVRSTARAIEEGLARSSSTILQPRVKFEGGQFEITATIKRGDTLYPVQARGHLLVEQKQRVRVAVTEARVSGGDVPPGIIESELAKINPILDLSKWPLNLHIQRLTLHNNTVELLAQ